MQRYYSIDILKAICSLLVIIIHISWKFSEEILPLTRCAVPCFFMISGFFLFKNGGIELSKIKSVLKHILKITIWSSVLFFLWTECMNIAGHKNLFYPPLKSIFSWIFYNNYPFSYHLWYLYAYIYVLIIVFFVEKLGKWHLLFRSIPFLLSGSIIFYILPFFNIELPLPIFRNYIFIGLPFFSLGALIKYKFSLFAKIRKSTLIILVSLLSISTLFEARFLEQLGKNPYLDIYLSTPFLSVILFLLFLTFEVPKSNWLAKIGINYSLGIYILHPIFTFLIFWTSKKAGIEYFVNWISPFAVFAATWAFLYAVRIIKEGVLSKSNL